MAHKCFISFKTEDMPYKKYIHDHLDVDMIDKSLHEPIDSEDEDYIMRKIRENYLSDSTVTIFLIGEKSAENLPYENQNFLKRELQASLYNGKNNTRNGVLGVVTPEMYDSVFQGTYTCSTCGGTHNCVKVNDNTVIKEFSVNYYIEPHDGCAWSEDERYCILVKWDDFVENPEKYVNAAYDKRTAPIAEKVKVRVTR